LVPNRDVPPTGSADPKAAVLFGDSDAHENVQPSESGFSRRLAT